MDVLFNITRYDAIEMIKRHFDANKTPVEVVKEGAFAGTYFRHIYSSVHSKWYKTSWKEFDELKNIDQGYYCSNYYISVDKYGVKCELHSDFGKIMD